MFNPFTFLKGIFAPPKKRKEAVFPSGLVSSYESGTPKVQPGKYKTYIDAYKGWTYKCVSKIATDVGSKKMGLYHRDRNGKIEEVEQHIFLDLMKNVNPNMNETEMKEDTQMFLDLVGNSYWYIPKNNLGIPIEIWTVPAQFMQIVPSKETFIAGYIYDDGSMQKIAFKEDEIVHFKYPNPKSRFYGMSPLEAGIQQINLSDYMNDYQSALYKNRARPDVVLETNEDLQPEELDRQYANWKRLFRGSDKAGKLAILTHGAKLKPFSMTPNELDFMEGKRFTREEICSYYNIPLMLMGLGKEVGNRSIGETLDYVYMRDCIDPRLKRIATKINEKIMPLYRAEGEFFVAFEDVIPKDKEFMIKERETNIKTGFSSINEERERVGIPPSTWGQVPLMPMSYMPVGSAGEGKGGKSVAIKKDINLFYARKKRIHIIQTERMEKRYSGRIRRMFKEWHDQILKNMSKLEGKSLPVTKDMPDFILIPLSDMQEQFGNMSKKEILAAIEVGFMEAFAELGFEVIWDPDYGLVISHLTDRAFKIKEVVKLYHEEIRELLIEGIKEGKGIPELSKDFRKWFSDTEKWKADRIARTEIGSARNMGEFTYSHKCEQVSEKTWLHSYSANPRKEHEAMDGVTIKKDELFYVMGEGLRFPGDYMASAENIVNCRCTCIYY